MLDCMSVTMNTYASVFGELLGWPDMPPDSARSLEIPSIEPTADGFVGFCTITAQQFQDFLLLVDRPDLLDDKQLRLAPQRFRRRDEVWGFIHDWTTKHTTEEAIELASAMRIPVAPIGNGAVLPSFDHFVERGVFVPHPSGRFIQPRVPYQLHPSAPLRASRDGERSDVPHRDLLDGMRVVDFTAFWAGPAATHMLAALGADVVKIESIQRPDGMRFTGVRPPTVDQWWEWGPVFHGANAGKRSVTLDLTSADGLALAKRLIAGADAVVENFTPRVLENFGLTWEVVHEVNPRALLVRMPAFGLTGPWRDRTGFAQTMEQISGLAWVTGYEDNAPVIPRGACDPMAGMHAVFALLLALTQREHDGLGRLVEVTMVETALNAAAEQVVEYTSTGLLLDRGGNGPPPRGVYKCAGVDQWVAIDAVTESQRRALPSALDEWCRSRTPQEVVDELWPAGVPVAVVESPREVLHNRQLAHRRLFESVHHPVCGEFHLPGAPFRFSSRGDAPWLSRPAPVLGEHTVEVLQADLGIDDAEMTRLTETGVIGTRPVGL
jgi:crotonobetainyl-CoA:carnitine CoA-transferase CaiB-like acyl-CoA transferase